MMQFTKNIIDKDWYEGKNVKRTKWAKQFGVGTVLYDIYGQRWEVMQDIHFDKYWFREIVTEK